VPSQYNPLDDGWGDSTVVRLLPSQHDWCHYAQRRHPLREARRTSVREWLDTCLFVYLFDGLIDLKFFVLFACVLGFLCTSHSRLFVCMVFVRIVCISVAPDTSRNYEFHSLQTLKTRTPHPDRFHLPCIRSLTPSTQTLAQTGMRASRRSTAYASGGGGRNRRYHTRSFQLSEKR